MESCWFSRKTFFFFVCCAKMCKVDYMCDTSHSRSGSTPWTTICSVGIGGRCCCGLSIQMSHRCLARLSLQYGSLKDTIRRPWSGRCALRIWLNSQIARRYLYLSVKATLLHLLKTDNTCTPTNVVLFVVLCSNNCCHTRERLFSLVLHAMSDIMNMRDVSEKYVASEKVDVSIMASR